MFNLRDCDMWQKSRKVFDDGRVSDDKPWSMVVQQLSLSHWPEPTNNISPLVSQHILFECLHLAIFQGCLDPFTGKWHDVQGHCGPTMMADCQTTVPNVQEGQLLSHARCLDTKLSDVVANASEHTYIHSLQSWMRIVCCASGIHMFHNKFKGKRKGDSRREGREEGENINVTDENLGHQLSWARDVQVFNAINGETWLWEDKGQAPSRHNWSCICSHSHSVNWHANDKTCFDTTTQSWSMIMMKCATVCWSSNCMNSQSLSKLHQHTLLMIMHMLYQS